MHVGVGIEKYGLSLNPSPIERDFGVCREFVCWV